MRKLDFIPKRDGDLDIFEENFSNKISMHADELGLDPAEVTGIKTSISNHRLAYSNMVSKRTESMSSNEENQLKKMISVRDIRRAAKLIKSLKPYTPTIGDSLGIIGPEKTPRNNAEIKPVLIATVVGEVVKIKFKKEDTDGVKIYSKRGDEINFTLLVFYLQSPYEDKRPKLDASKPEHREYYATLVEANIDIGKQSDVIKVTIP